MNVLAAFILHLITNSPLYKCVKYVVRLLLYTNSNAVLINIITY